MSTGRTVAQGDQRNHGWDGDRGQSHGTPTTAGHALHDLLDRLRGTQQVTVLNGWADVLGADAGSAEWAQRHAEVVGLFQTVQQQLFSLPEGDRNRARAMRYVPAWYRAVVWQSHWQTSTERPVQVISDEALDQLASTAEILAYRLPGAAAVRPTDEAIARLQRELNDWLSLLEEAEDVPQSVREEITGQIKHVLWLLENIGTFGAGAVVRETRAVVGRVTEEVSIRPWARKWVARVAALVVALGLLTQGLEATNQALEAAKETVTVVSEIVRDVTDPKPEQGERPALPSGTSAPPGSGGE